MRAAELNPIMANSIFAPLVVSHFTLAQSRTLLTAPLQLVPELPPYCYLCQYRKSASHLEATVPPGGTVIDSSAILSEDFN